MRRLLQPKNIMVSAHHRAREHELGKYISILNIIQVLAAAWNGQVMGLVGIPGWPCMTVHHAWLPPGLCTRLPVWPPTSQHRQSGELIASRWLCFH